MMNTLKLWHFRDSRKMRHFVLSAADEQASCGRDGRPSGTAKRGLSGFTSRGWHSWVLTDARAGLAKGRPQGHLGGIAEGPKDFAGAGMGYAGASGRRRASRRSHVVAIGFLAVLVLGMEGCATVTPHGESLVPTRYVTETGPYKIYTNFSMPADSPPVRELIALQRQIEETLHVLVDAGESPVEVNILSDQQAFSHFLTFYYPELPPRRAFFFAQGTRRVVYTYMGDRLEEDLRHESTHALLHASVAELPLWLDEGLAEYFEGQEVRDGLNPEHLARLPEDLATGWVPDLGRLEQLDDVRQMTPRDYRESWAWVHYLLHSTSENKAALLAYLYDLRNHEEPVPLSSRLGAESGSGRRLSAYVKTVGKRPATMAARPGKAPTVRLQSEPMRARERVKSVSGAVVDEKSAPAKRKGFFGRMFENMFGGDEER